MKKIVLYIDNVKIEADTEKQALHLYNYLKSYVTKSKRPLKHNEVCAACGHIEKVKKSKKQPEFKFFDKGTK